MYEQALKELGLTSKEVDTYLGNLQLGSALVQEIAQQSGLNRTSTYDILQSLQTKGFASYTIQSGKRYYQVIEPKEILQLIAEKTRLVKKAIPQLTALTQSAVKRPEVLIYTGREGIKTLLEMILSEAKEFCSFASKTDVVKLLKFYFPNFVKRRKKKGIKVRLITDAPPLDRDAPCKILKNRITKTAMWLYDGKIIMISLEGNLTGILIHEQNFYQTHQLMFDILWENID